MKRIMIIGCSGSGKSTLARALGEKTGIPVTHLDQLWWKPGWVESSKEEFDEKLSAVLSHDEWIIDGNYSRTLSHRLQRCDTVIYLDFPVWTCLWGVIRRVMSYYGKNRPDMGKGCPERFDWGFLVWIWSFNRKNRPRIRELLGQFPGKEVHILKSHRQVANFLKSV